jgi:hypothetical protein
LVINTWGVTDDAEADMLSFRRTEPQRAPHAEAKRSGALEPKEERKRKWREAGRWMGWLKVDMGNFQIVPCACVSG